MLQQGGILVNFVACALGMGGQFASDDFQAFRRTDDHAIGAQLLFVVREVSHANVGLAEEAVAARGVSRSQSTEEELQGLAIEHADKPTDGANEARARRGRSRSWCVAK